MDGNDVGMIQRGGGLGLLEKAAPALGVGDTFRRQNFDRDKAVEAVSRAL